MACAITQGPILRRALSCSWVSSTAVTVLESLIIFEQGDLTFSFCTRPYKLCDQSCFDIVCPFLVVFLNSSCLPLLCLSSLGWKHLKNVLCPSLRTTNYLAHRTVVVYQPSVSYLATAPPAHCHLHVLSAFAQVSSVTGVPGVERGVSYRQTVLGLVRRSVHSWPTS